MKYFTFWVKESFDIRILGGEENISLLSGSNISKADALDKAKQQAQIIEQRINQGDAKDEYEVAIKEHVAEVIDESSIVTVCRYGAKVLNTTQYTILDLDDYPFEFMDMFRSLGKLSKKERIVYKFLQKIKRTSALGSDFRVYETAKGVRVIGKTYLDPSNKKTASLLRNFAVDWIYIHMSKKQNCYRARITPKPYRMRINTIRIKTPLDCEGDAYKSWLAEYERSAAGYSVVKLIQSVGQDFSGEVAIQLHDSVCNAHRNHTLA